MPDEVISTTIEDNVLPTIDSLEECVMEESWRS